MGRENALIDQAQQAIHEAERVLGQEKEAKKICAATRLTCNDLLCDPKRGKAIKDKARRIVFGIMAATGVGALAIGLAELTGLSEKGIHQWEISDTVTWKTSLKGTSVEITSVGGTDPKKAYYVDIQIQGLDEFLRLHDNSGEIFSKENYREEIVPRMGRMYHGKIRNPSLEDAQNWQKVVNDLR